LKVPSSQQRAEDYLNSILPPMEFTEKGKLWVRYVSPTPATKVEVLNLKEMLDKKLTIGQARNVGICPIRENLF
jgi:dynein light intermediate chain